MNMRPIALLALSLLALAACDKSGSSQSSPSPAASSAAPLAPGAPVVETDAYKAVVLAAPSYKKGEPATFDVVLTAKSGFHVNAEYPAKFKPVEVAGVKYAESRLERAKHADAFTTQACAAGTGHDNESCVLSVKVKFTPEQAGSVKLGGTLDVSVCNKDTCLIEKKQLEIEAPVT